MSTSRGRPDLSKYNLRSVLLCLCAIEELKEGKPEEVNEAIAILCDLDTTDRPANSNLASAIARRERNRPRARA